MCLRELGFPDFLKKLPVNFCGPSSKDKRSMQQVYRTEQLLMQIFSS